MLEILGDFFVYRKSGYENVQQTGRVLRLHVNRRNDQFIEPVCCHREASRLRGKCICGIAHDIDVAAQHLAAAQRRDHFTVRIRHQKQSAGLRNPGPDFGRGIADRRALR